MPVSFPERTLEQWFAAYVLARYPGAELWAPTQNDQFNWDAAFGNGKLFIFECKRGFSNRRSTRVDIDVDQLNWYLGIGRLRDCVFYLLPDPRRPDPNLAPGPGSQLGLPYGAPMAQPRQGAAQPGAALPKPHVVARATLDQWMFVSSAVSLQAYLQSTKRRSVPSPGSNVRLAPEPVGTFFTNADNCLRGYRDSPDTPVPIRDVPRLAVRSRGFVVVRLPI
jgi:hypothetical protein